MLNENITPDQIDLDSKPNEKLETITFGESATPTVTETPSFQPLAPAAPETQAAARNDFLDWDAVEEFEDFEDLKPGTYQGKFTEVGIKEYKNGGRGFELVFKLDKGGQQEWTYLTFEHTNQNAINMGRRDVSSILTNFKIEKPTTLNGVLDALKSLVGTPAEMTIVWNAKDKNRPAVIDYSSADVDDFYVNKKFKPMA